MSLTTTPVAALLSIVLLTSCAATAPQIEIPSEILTAPTKPDLPGPGNHARARYILTTEEWMDGAIVQIETLAGVVCVVAQEVCSGA